jgi:hypothetical protein
MTFMDERKGGQKMNRKTRRSVERRFEGQKTKGKRQKEDRRPKTCFGKLCKSEDGKA